MKSEKNEDDTFEFDIVIRQPTPKRPVEVSRSPIHRPYEGSGDNYGSLNHPALERLWNV